MRRILVGGALAIAFAAVLNGGASAHPSSGIVVDQKGQVFFQDIVGGVIWKIDVEGKLTKFSDVKGGHWLALDADGTFSKAAPKYYRRITPDGVKPALIHAEGGAPLVVNPDGNLYYASGDKDDRPGGLALTRETPDGKRTSFSPALKTALHQIDHGITGLANGPDGSLYVACWTAVFKVKMDGTVKTLVHPITVKDCDEDRADHKASNRLPYLRGLAVGPDGTVYAAATSCHCVIKITPAGQVEMLLNAERPWSPTGVAINGQDLYVLEYTNANGPATEGWRPWVRKLGHDGKLTTLAILSAEAKEPGPSP
jgi:sugar lactone lactonase YvrE